jgi:thiol-disulfide isomerase/thioredoxin
MLSVNSAHYPQASENRKQGLRIPNLSTPLILVLIFLFIWRMGTAQNTVIQGVAPGAGGRYLIASVASDYITGTEKNLGRVKVDTTGKFRIEVPVEKTSLIRISIDFHTAEFFSEPGKKYELIVEPYKYDDVKELNPFINSSSLQFRFANIPENDINYVLAEFDGIYNAFLIENFNALYRDHVRSLVDTLRNRVRAAVGEPKDEYIRNYMDYKMANVILLTQSLSQTQIGFRYFTTKPVLQGNVEYMDFFNTYFTKYMFATSRILKKNDYHALLSGSDPYSALMKALGADTLLKPEALREMVLIKGLYEMYPNQPDDQPAIISVLRAIEKNSKDPENRIIARNAARSLTHLQTGTPAPSWVFRNRDNTAYVRMDSLRGKVIVLNFFTTYCTGCCNEMDLLHDMSEKYKGRVVFVSVSSEYYWIRMLYHINLKKNWDWTFCHIGDQIEMLREYDVRTLPLFVIIDRKGNIFRYPADYPSNGLEKQIEECLLLPK